MFKEKPYPHDKTAKKALGYKTGEHERGISFESFAHARSPGLKLKVLQKAEFLVDAADKDMIRWVGDQLFKKAQQNLDLTSNGKDMVTIPSTLTIKIKD